MEDRANTYTHTQSAYIQPYTGVWESCFVLVFSRNKPQQSPPPWESGKLRPESNAGHPPEPQLAKKCPSTAPSDPLMSHGSHRDTTSLTGTSSISFRAPGRARNDFKLLSRQPCPHRSCQRLHAGATLQPPGRPRSRRHTPASLTCLPPRPYLQPATPPG